MNESPLSMNESPQVLAPPQRSCFLRSLRAAGVTDLPEFRETSPTSPTSPTLPTLPSSTIRPWGVPGEHLRRSAVARYRSDVSICHSMEEVRAALFLMNGWMDG